MVVIYRFSPGHVRSLIHPIYIHPPDSVALGTCGVRALIHILTVHTRYKIGMTARTAVGLLPPGKSRTLTLLALFFHLVIAVFSFFSLE